MSTTNAQRILNGVSVSDEELERMVVRDPHRPGPARGRLLAEQIPVWALISYVGALGGTKEPADVTPETVAQVAHDYDISPTAVLAALHYYEGHRGAVDALIAANDGD